MKKIVIIVGTMLITLMNFAQAEDSRTPINVSTDRHEQLLAEMRGFLISINGIVSGLANDDMESVAKVARLNGRIRMRQDRMNSGQRGRGFNAPQEFQMMGQTLHGKFDEIALDAEQMGDPQQTLEQLAATTALCTACHASYRFVSK